MKSNTIYDLFNYQVESNPNALAIIDIDRHLTRKEFSNIVDSIADIIPKETNRIGIILDHSAKMIATLLAVLKLGKTYVPVEPTFPKNRIQFMMEDADVDLIITQNKYKNLAENFPILSIDELSRKEELIDEVERSPENLAYILYTSGSTGKPKGVAVTNKNVTHYVRAFQNEFHLEPEDIMLQYSVCSFDIFTEEVFASLLNGAALAIPSSEVRNDINKLIDFIDKNNISVISGFPYLLLEFNHLDKLPESLRLLISGGDVLRGDYIDNLIDKVTIYNTYGPSETTVCATYFKCNENEPLEDGTYPVGKPIKNVEVQILDSNLNPVSEGEIGEIFISGNGVSNGYIGKREDENKAFFTDLNGKRVYQSGDLGYYLPDGNIAFLYRKDNQVMIEGKRVEPAEVENIIIAVPEVEKATVQAYRDKKDLSYMIAYIVFKDQSMNLDRLVKEIARFLPSYMIPDFFIQLKDLPVNANGKIDSKSLPVIIKDGNSR